MGLLALRCSLCYTRSHLLILLNHAIDFSFFTAKKLLLFKNFDAPAFQVLKTSGGCVAGVLVLVDVALICTELSFVLFELVLELFLANENALGEFKGFNKRVSRCPLPLSGELP